MQIYCYVSATSPPGPDKDTVLVGEHATFAWLLNSVFSTFGNFLISHTLLSVERKRKSDHVLPSKLFITFLKF